MRTDRRWNRKADSPYYKLLLLLDLLDLLDSPYYYYYYYYYWRQYTVKTVLRIGDNLVEKLVCYGAPNFKSDLIF